jgi:class 3 adenylate cyclase
MLSDTSKNTIDAHVFFTDIVGLSNPKMSTENQIARLTFLYKSIASCQAFKATPSRKKLILPTGDGVAICFLEEPELPLQLAIQLHQKIRKYNNGRVPSESLYVRIGIHSDPVFIIRDLKGNKNIWGPGIILARRIMDLGEKGHVLVSSRVANMLLPVSGKYKQYLHQLGPHTLKHNVKMTVFSAYSNSGMTFGNDDWPKAITPINPALLYPYLEVNATIKDPETMLVHYQRIYEIQNASDEPVRTVVHEIASDVPKSWKDLNLRIVDDDGNNLVISDVEIDDLYQKKFDTTFSRPLEFGDKRRYVMEYDVEEPHRSFENMFFERCGKFVVRIDYPINEKVNTPKVFEVSSERNKNKEREHPVQPSLIRKNGNRQVVEWSVEDCAEQQSFRFKW